MSSEQPTRFENYPGADPSAPEPAPEDVTQAAPPALADPWTRPYRSPQRVIGGTSEAGRPRRMVSGLMAIPVVVAGLVGFSFVANHNAEPYDSGYGVPGVVVPEDPGYDPPEPDADDATTLWLGEYLSADLPEGWEVVEETADGLVIARGTNRVEARLVAPVDGEVADALPALADEWRDRFVGDLGEAVDTTGDDYVARATLTATGTAGKRDARFRADLWQAGQADTALLIVQVLTAGKGSDAEAGAKAFAAELSAQVG